MGKEWPSGHGCAPSESKDDETWVLDFLEVVKTTEIHLMRSLISLVTNTKCPV